MSEGVVTRITAKGMVRTVFKTSVITTTTRARIHPENETRAFSITISDDPDLTRRVIEAEAKTAAGMARPAVDGTLLLAWREALSQLQGGDVVVPFAADLAETFPHDRVRARRDFQRTVNLVRACALLHQESRTRDPQGRIVVVERAATTRVASQATVRSWCTKFTEDGVLEEQGRGGRLQYRRRVAAE